MTVDDVEFLRECVECGAFHPQELPPDPARLRRLQRICRSLEIDAFAGWVILDLLERMDSLEQDLHGLRSALKSKRSA